MSGDPSPINIHVHLTLSPSECWLGMTNASGVGARDHGERGVVIAIVPTLVKRHPDPNG